MATLQEARLAYRQAFGLDPAPSFTADQLMRGVAQAKDIKFVRELYGNEFGMSGYNWSGDTRDIGQLLRAVRNNNELQDARADYASAGNLGGGYDWSKDKRTTEQLRRGISELTGGISDLSPYTPKEESTQKKGVGISDKDPTTPDLKILQGAKMKWYFDKSSGKWYVGYGLPNSTRELIFEAEPDQMDALFGKGKRPSMTEAATLKTLTQRAGTTFGGSIAEMEGTGTFESEVQKVTTLALDEGRLPEWAAKDGAALDIIFVAQSEGKNTDWVIDQLSRLTSFKTRFPKLDKFAKDNNLTTAEAVTGFLEYEAGIKQAMKALPNAGNIVTPALVAGLLDKGHSLETVQQTVQGFRRMEQYAPAMEAFNQVLTAQGSQPITSIQGMLNFVTGKASPELYDLWEQSSIQEAAVGAGLGSVFSVQDAIQIAKGTDQTLETATQGAQKAAELLLRLRHQVDVGQFGLDSEELIDIAFGQTARSGRSEAEIMENINRAVLSAQKTMQQKTKPFTGFSATGTPQAKSLGNLRQGS
jgi:hypothetical protein